MKIVTLLAVASTVLIPATLFADDKGNQDWAEKALRAYLEKARMAAKADNGFLRAAAEYRKKAHHARENGSTDKANIYNHLADHKVAAAKAAKEGRSYDWTDYQALQKKLFGLNRAKPKRFTPVRLNIE